MVHGQLVIDKHKARAWSAETPHMYTLLVTLSVAGAGGGGGGGDAGVYEVAEVVRVRVGLRHVEVRDGRLRVNGRAVTLRGVNRHEHAPDTGHVISVAAMAHDIRLLKDFNFNCVRCSHYPCDERFYQLCDELGMYVIDEVCLHSTGSASVRARACGRGLERLSARARMRVCVRAPRAGGMPRVRRCDAR